MLTKISKTGSLESMIPYITDWITKSVCAIQNLKQTNYKFSRSGFKDPWKWLNQHRFIRNFASAIKSSSSCLTIPNDTSVSCKQDLFNKIYKLGYNPKVIRFYRNIFGCVPLKREVMNSEPRIPESSGKRYHWGNKHARAWKFKNVPLNENKQLHLLRTWLTQSSNWNVIYTVPSKPRRILWSVTKSTWKVMSGTGKGSCLFLMIPDSRKKSQFT